MDIRDIRSTLMGKLRAVEDRQPNHVWFYLQYNGKEHRGPKLSHSWRGSADDQQIDWVKKPLKLNKREFEQLVDCTLGKDAFFLLWAERMGLA